MRKYRGKRKDNGELVYGSHCDLAGLHYIAEYPVGAGQNTDGKIIGSWHEVHLDTVGQFTGRTDKNRVEIYEDDLYKAKDGIVYQVQMSLDGWGLFSKGKKGNVPSLYWINVCDKTKGEVIGNVHKESKE